MEYLVVQEVPGRIHVRLKGGRLSNSDERRLEGKLRLIPGVVSLTPYRAIGELAVAYAPSFPEVREQLLDELARFLPSDRQRAVANRA